MNSRASPTHNPPIRSHHVLITLMGHSPSSPHLSGFLIKPHLMTSSSPPFIIISYLLSQCLPLIIVFLSVFNPPTLSTHLRHTRSIPLHHLLCHSRSITFFQIFPSVIFFFSTTILPFFSVRIFLISIVPRGINIESNSNILFLVAISFALPPGSYIIAFPPFCGFQSPKLSILSHSLFTVSQEKETPPLYPPPPPFPPPSPSSPSLSPTCPSDRPSSLSLTKACTSVPLVNYGVNEDNVG